MNYGPVKLSIEAAQEAHDEGQAREAEVLAQIALARAVLELARVNDQLITAINRSAHLR